MRKKLNRRHYFRRKLFRGLRFVRQQGYRLFSLAVIASFFLILPGRNYYETLEMGFKEPLVRASDLDSFSAQPYPQRTFSESVPYNTAEALVILDASSMAPMFELNPTEKLRPASTTKLMTALVTLDYYNISQTLTVQRLAPVKKDEPESEMGLGVGDKLSVRTLLYGLLVPSGNDAAYTLADNYPGGIENFVYAMNTKAKSLHMINTHFDNPVGVDSPGQISSARDLALLAAETLKNDLVAKIVSTGAVTLTDVNKSKAYPVKNVNQLLGAVSGLDGIKTGFTDEAGQCLISTVNRQGHRIILVMLKSQDRFGETARLVEWVFRNYRWAVPSEHTVFDGHQTQFSVEV